MIDYNIYIQHDPISKTELFDVVTDVNEEDLLEYANDLIDNKGVYYVMITKIDKIHQMMFPFFFRYGEYDFSEDKKRKL